MHTQKTMAFHLSPSMVAIETKQILAMAAN
jgi:hypothetical protein